MKIFVIPSVYPNEVNLNSGIYVHELNKALHDIGNEIIVLDASAFNYENWNKKSTRSIEHEVMNGINIYSFHYRGFMTNKFPKNACRLYSKNLNRLYERASSIHGVPDIIISHFTFTSGYGANVLSKKYNIPNIVVEHHSMFLSKDIKIFIKKITKEVITNCNQFVCVSNHLVESIKSLINVEENIKVIPNMVDSRFSFKEIPKDSKFVFFSAGNLVSNKQFDLLINSFIKAFRSNDDVLLRIAGDGKEKNYLNQLIKKHNRGHQIKLIGYVDRETILKNYQSSHCFVLFSKYETFGIVYREALSVGRPIITSKNGGILEDWNSTYGLLVEDLDIENCSKSLIEMREKYSDYDNKGISEAVHKKYSKDIVVREYIKLINSIK